MEEDYQDIIDDTEDDLDNAQELQEAQLEQYATGTVPEAKEQHNIYNWFWKVVRLSDPFRLVKVGNLSNVEIGEHVISIRDALNLSHLGSIFGHSTFGDYFATVAKINSATSMAKKGWFMDLSISQKKVRERSKSLSSGEQPWRVFKKKKTPTED